MYYGFVNKANIYFRFRLSESLTKIKIGQNLSIFRTFVSYIFDSLQISNYLSEHSPSYCQEQGSSIYYVITFGGSADPPPPYLDDVIYGWFLKLCSGCWTVQYHPQLNKWAVKYLPAVGCNIDQVAGLNFKIFRNINNNIQYIIHGASKKGDMEKCKIFTNKFGTSCKFRSLGLL